MNCPKCGADLRKPSAIRRHVDGCYVEPGYLQTGQVAADLCNSCGYNLSIGTKQSTCFDDLSDVMQAHIIQNKFGDRELTSEDETALRALTPDELFEAWCDWNGLINWSGTIHAAHKEIYK